MTTKVTSGLISGDASSVDLNIDSGTLYLDASENKVGIGTFAPAGKLEVAGSSNSTYFKVGGDDASNARGLTFTSSASAAFNGAVHTITAPSSQGAIALKGYNTEGLRVISDGKVGIGTTTPQFQMLTIKSSSATGNNLRLETGSELGVISVNDAGNLQITAHGADERIEFLNGTGSGTILAAFDSHGLKFGSDTAAANALDDYEEGTWTPTVSSGTISTVANSSEYTKIGDMVFAQTRISGFSDTTSGNYFVLQGLPYSVGTTESHIGTAWGNFSQQIMFFYVSGNAYFSGAGYNAVVHSQLGSTQNVIVS